MGDITEEDNESGKVTVVCDDDDDEQEEMEQEVDEMVPMKQSSLTYDGIDIVMTRMKDDNDDEVSDEINDAEEDEYVNKDDHSDNVKGGDLENGRAPSMFDEEEVNAGRIMIKDDDDDSD